MAGPYLRGGRVNKKKQARFLAKTWNSKMKTLNLATPVRSLRGIANRPAGRYRLYGRVPRQQVSGAGRFTALNGNMTNSKCMHLATRLRKAPYLMSKVAVSTISSDQYAFRQNSTYGFQGVSSMGLLTQQYLAKLPLYPTTSPGVSLSLPYRILVQSIVSNITIANACTAPVELELYDIVLKRDLPLALQWKQNANVWTVGLAYPDQCWDMGSYANNNTIPTGGTGPQANIAASPFDSTLFNAYFKVKKRTKVLLGQGGIHRHTIVSTPNKILDSVLFNQVSNASMTTPTSGNLGWKSLTSFCMVVQKGTPCSNAETATDVTTSETHVDIVQDWRIKWTWVSDSTYGVQNNDSLTTPASGQIINVGNGTAEAITFTV